MAEPRRPRGNREGRRAALDLASVASTLQNRAAMIRPFLRSVLLLAAPALAAAAAAPTPNLGQITFADVPRSAEDGFINAEECSSPSTRIKLSWRVQPDTGRSVAEVRSYQLYATNKTDENATTGPCPIENGDKDDTSLKAGPVGTAIELDLRDPMIDVEFATSAIAASAGKGTCSTTANEAIGICIQARDASGTDIGTARGQLTLSLSKPAAPTGVSAQPGENALNVSWDRVDGASSGAAAAVDYQVDAVVVATTAEATDPVLQHSSGRVAPTGDRPSVRLGGLVNGVLYEVRVFAFSTADNPSDFDPANAVTASPVPVNDFFETYRAAGGVEQGGCASGAAGPVAIGAVAFLLALVVRRRKA